MQSANKTGCQERLFAFEVARAERAVRDAEFPLPALRFREVLVAHLCRAEDLDPAVAANEMVCAGLGDQDIVLVNAAFDQLRVEARDRIVPGNAANSSSISTGTARCVGSANGW